MSVSDGSGCQMSGSGSVRVLKFFRVQVGSGFEIFLRVQVRHDEFGLGFGFFCNQYFPKIDPP